MDYTPRYAQPFTLGQAANLDVSIIFDEISRLNNSLKHLRETQQVLQDHISATEGADPDIGIAFEENKMVIGSQEERILILRLALSEKGVVLGDHYDIHTPPGTGPTASTATAPEFVGGQVDRQESSNGGIHL